MGRWTQFDDDSYRLPAGMTRVGYDSDSGKYTFCDSDGCFWEGDERGEVTEARHTSTQAMVGYSYSEDGTIHITRTMVEPVEDPRSPRFPNQSALRRMWLQTRDACRLTLRIPDSPTPAEASACSSAQTAIAPITPKPSLITPTKPRPAHTVARAPQAVKRPMSAHARLEFDVSQRLAREAAEQAIKGPMSAVYQVHLPDAYDDDDDEEDFKDVKKPEDLCALGTCDHVSHAKLEEEWMAKTSLYNVEEEHEEWSSESEEEQELGIGAETCNSPQYGVVTAGRSTRRFKSPILARLMK